MNIDEEVDGACVGGKRQPVRQNVQVTMGMCLALPVPFPLDKDADVP